MWSSSGYDTKPYSDSVNKGVVSTWYQGNPDQLSHTQLKDWLLRVCMQTLYRFVKAATLQGLNNSLHGHVAPSGKTGSLGFLHPQDLGCG